MYTTVSRLLLILTMFALSVVVNAQDSNAIEFDDRIVHVTTQDFVSLRALPSTSAERLDVIPPETTLLAYGRTSRTDWVQVEYNGQMGWLSALYLIWTGQIIELTIDGMNPPDFIRRTVVLGQTFRETPIYREGIDSSTRLGTIPAEEEFEVTGHVGSGDRFWLQINYQGQLVWVGSWDVIIIDGQIDDTLNGAYRYVYGRANIQLQADVDNIGLSLVRIETIWTQLRNGQEVSCEPVPPYATRSTANRDIRREPIFNPVVIALDDSIIDINATVSRFEDLCQSDAPFVTIEEVNQQLNDLSRARRNVTLAQALLNELSDRDPLVN